ncbi:MAG: hypothetical protein JRI46_05260 [Deltaproteobacteria bacterium]|nr:hypothetical protein [Deltaproteobacteria bacterium]
MSIFPAAIQDRALALEKVVEALEGRYGVPYKDSPSDPLEVLISTILSQNTNGQNRDLPTRCIIRMGTMSMHGF